MGGPAAALERALAPDVVVRSLRSAVPGFDPRRAVTTDLPLPDPAGRRPPPTDRHRTLEIPDHLDVGAMRAAASRLVGRDFAALGSDPRGRPSAT